MENNAQKCAVKCKSDPRPDLTRPDPIRGWTRSVSISAYSDTRCTASSVGLTSHLLINIKYAKSVKTRKNAYVKLTKL